MINKTLKKLITFTPRNIEMMEAIAKQSGWDTPTEIVKRGIEELYTKYFPAYRTGQGTPLTEEAQIQSATIKAKAKHVAKKTAEDLRMEGKVNMCNTLLGGEVQENPDGSKTCVFTQYTLSGDNELRVPLAQVDPIIAETSLFMPSKAAIFKNRPDIKKHYEKINKQETEA